MAENCNGSGNEDIWTQKANQRKIRKKYRQLSAELLLPEIREEYIRPENRGVEKSLSDIDDLFGRVRDTQGAALDAQALKVVVKYGAEQVQGLKTGLVTFDPVVFAEKLRTLHGNRFDEGTQAEQENGENVAGRETMDWVKIGKRVSSFFRFPPSCSFLFGSLSVEPKPATIRRAAEGAAGRRRMPDASQKITADEVKAGEEVREEGTTKEVERINTILRGLLDENEGFVSFWQFVIDPNSFSKTVENMFHFSFLIKEGVVSLKEDPDKPYLHWITVPSEESQEEAQTKKQAVLNITMQMWKDLKEAFCEGDALIPPV